MLSQRGKPLLVHDGHTFGIQYVRKDKKYWQCNLSRKFNCKARVTTTDTGEIIVTNNEHCHTEIRQHLRKDYQRNKVMMNALLNLTSMRRHSAVNTGLNSLSNLKCLPSMLAVVSQHGQQGSSDSNILDLAKATTNTSVSTINSQDDDSSMIHDLSTTATSAISSHMQHFMSTQQHQHHQTQEQDNMTEPEHKEYHGHDDTESDNGYSPLDCGLGLNDTTADG